MSLRLLLIAGARPNFMKIAPVRAALAARGHDAILVHTGQHYDAAMSDTFFTELGIPAPHHHLGVGSGSHAQQTARIMEAFEPVLLQEKPDWVVVVGDVNSTIACALVAAKLRHSLGCRIAHVEAGLRSNDWSMPEEVNRVLTDQLSDLLLTPSRDAHPNLAREGIDDARVKFVGNVMIDTLFHQLTAARSRTILAEVGLFAGEFTLVTLHRPSNVDEPEHLRTILEGLAEIARETRVVFPMHPRTRGTVERAGLDGLLHDIVVREPLGYIDMLALTDGAAVVVTDSGGLQEETTALGVPCVTLRETTERPATITHGTNQLAPWPLTARGIVDSWRAARARPRLEPGTQVPEGWDGKAAERVALALEHA